MQPPVHIGYEDDHLLVAWKPHGLLTSGNHAQTFQRRIRMRFPSEVRKQIGACHRLDFPTAGWVVFGKHLEATRAMGALFAERQVAKAYLALVHGHVATSLRMEWPLDGKDSTTHALLLAHGTIAGAGAVSLVQVHPLTGRTHQIRRHLHGTGHGIVGDDTHQHPPEKYRGKGLFLCAHGLGFDHPLTLDKRVELLAPPSKKFTKIPFVHRSDFIAQLHLSSHA